MSYLRKPFEGEAGMVPLLRESEALKLEQVFPSALGKLCVFLSNSS